MGMLLSYHHITKWLNMNNKKEQLSFNSSLMITANTMMINFNIQFQMHACHNNTILNLTFKIVTYLMISIHSHIVC